MLGSDVRAACEAAGHDTVALARADLDITEDAAVQAAIGAARPDVVINCAAWTNVDGAEAQADQAGAINGAGAGNVARAAARASAWTVHVSSDYVFDGAKRSPYVESDPPAPLSAYGASKLAGEHAVAREAPDSHTIVRSSWLFGTAGKCFPKTIVRLASERGQLAIVSDQVGCPTYTGHLAPALLAIAADPAPGLLHVASDDECSWFEFAREIVAAAGLVCDVNPITTEQYPLPATRPAYSVMRSERGAPELPEWRHGLREFMAAGVTA